MPSIVDYASLSQAITDFWARSDLSPMIDYFVQGADDNIYNDLLQMNQGRGISQIEKSATGTIASNAIAVPSDYLALKNAQVFANGGNYPLQRVTNDYIYEQYAIPLASGIPRVIARQGTNFIFGPYADGTYTVQYVYWAKAPILSSVNPTNWMVTASPTTLFAACNATVAQFLKDTEAYQYWDSVYKGNLSSLIATSKAEEVSGSTPTQRAI